MSHLYVFMVCIHVKKNTPKIKGITLTLLCFVFGFVMVSELGREGK